MILIDCYRKLHTPFANRRNDGAHHKITGRAKNMESASMIAEQISRTLSTSPPKIKSPFINKRVMQKIR